jgi:transcription termination/antitermination protein NusA
MDNRELIESFAEFKDFKNIDRVTMMRVLEDVFRNILEKKYGTDENFDVIINTEKGDLEIWHNREIVPDGEVENPATQIAYSDAIKIEPDFEIGEEVSEEIKITSFGRRAIMSARQNLINKIIELEKSDIIKKYQDREGDMVSGEVYQIWRNEVLVLDDEGNELILPKFNQIPGDYFKKGDTIRAVVDTVDMRNNNPVITISRTAPEFLERLMELEVPEIADGLITIKETVREPGERAKIAVETYDDRVDPVGACVGMRGSRIHGIVRELQNENIDVINFTENTNLYISRALSPAKISNIVLDKENKKAQVYLKPDQVSLAIGKGGLNIKLAAKLTGFEIDVFREAGEDEFDIDLEEFADEIDNHILDALKSIGCDTAKSVLDLSEEELVRRTELDTDTIKETRKILNSEFE